MERVTAQKLAQARDLVAASGVDAWITFVRETAGGGDPILPLIFEGGLTWSSALIVSPRARIAVVGRFDADPVRATGDWDEVLPYDQSLREVLLAALERAVDPSVARPRLAVNFSRDDAHADGITHGMYLALCQHLCDSRFESSLVSAEPIVSALRSRKTAEELRRMRGAIEETDRIFREVEARLRPGVSEREIYDFVQARIDERGLGYGWDRSGDPIVNVGPDSMVGHGLPSPEVRLAPGHVVHIDLGVVREGYSSDLQRCWYLARPGESALPEPVRRALEAVRGAISAGADVLRPGVAGWMVDEMARRFVVEHGYPEYLHALGHQVGRLAHDGGALLGPAWDRYGRLPFLPVEADQVFTLELGVTAQGHGFVGLEEMVRVTPEGVEWLTERQTEIPLLPRA